jgi:hypothetical protein
MVCVEPTVVGVAAFLRWTNGDHGCLLSLRIFRCFNVEIVSGFSIVRSSSIINRLAQASFEQREN